jgi:hypothetical protein
MEPVKDEQLDNDAHEGFSIVDCVTPGAWKSLEQQKGWP